MNKKVLVLLFLALNLLSVACDKTQSLTTNPITTAPTIGVKEVPKSTQIVEEIPKPINNLESYYEIIKGNDNKFTVVLYDKNKKMIKETHFPKEPFVETLEDHIISVRVSTGSPANYNFFYDISTQRISPEYFNLSLYEKGKAVYMNKGKLIITDAFDKNLFFREITRDFSPTAVPSNDLIEAKFLEPNKLYIKYLEGKAYTEKTEIIDLNE